MHLIGNNQISLKLKTETIGAFDRKQADFNLKYMYEISNT